MMSFPARALALLWLSAWAAGCDSYGDVIGGTRQPAGTGGGAAGGAGGGAQAGGGLGGLGGGLGGGSGGGGGGGTSASALSDAGLPCVAANLLAGHCIRCHGSPPTGGAPVPLTSRADLLVTATATESYGQRSVARLKDAAAPMPPTPAPLPPAADVTAFEAWVNGGMTEGSCANVVGPTDAGPIDAGPAPLTCASGVYYPRAAAGDAHGGPNMAPGWACRHCHLGQDILNQNPGGALQRLDQVFDVMGTVFPALHEKDYCESGAGDGGTQVEILDSAGAVKGSFAVNSGGNFFGNVSGGLPNPYQARVVRGGLTRAMNATQTEGDCNSCHTEQGLNLAPGRIVPP